MIRKRVKVHAKHVPKRCAKQAPVASTRRVPEGIKIVYKDKEGTITQAVYKCLSSEPDYISPEEFTNTLKELVYHYYRETMYFNWDYLCDIFEQIYGKKMYFRVPISDLIFKIKQMKENGATIEEMTKAIVDHLGYKQFNRIIEKNGKEIPVPVDSSRIQTAYKLVKEKRSVAVVEDVLYL